jgi:hypothetical protein
MPVVMATIDFLFTASTAASLTFYIMNWRRHQSTAWRANEDDITKFEQNENVADLYHT